jgi:hypothetical protein
MDYSKKLITSVLQDQLAQDRLYVLITIIDNIEIMHVTITELVKIIELRKGMINLRKLTYFMEANYYYLSFS